MEALKRLGEGGVGRVVTRQLSCAAEACLVVYVYSAGARRLDLACYRVGFSLGPILGCLGARVVYFHDGAVSRFERQGQCDVVGRRFLRSHSLNRYLPDRPSLSIYRFMFPVL